MLLDRPEAGFGRAKLDEDDSLPDGGFRGSIV
jgi:hypothetical protein